MRKNDLEYLTNLGKSYDMKIQKTDKGNSIVILDKKVYLERMNEMLYKNEQFLKLPIEKEKDT